MMARLIHFWKHVRDAWRQATGLGCVRDGILVLGAGKHEIMVETGCRPEKVYLTVQEPRHSRSTCGSDLNMICALPTHHGFIIYATIHSNTAEIEWVAEY